MKKHFKLTYLSICACLMLGMCGCSNVEKTETTESVKKDFDICIYNTDTSHSEKFRKMCDEYTNRTGKIIKVINPSDEDNPVEKLESYFNSNSSPDIFTVTSISELKKWKLSGNVWDFNNADEESFKKVVNDIPSYLRLSSNTADSFGVPYTTEGFGFVLDPKMIASLFGGDKYRDVINDLQDCTYDEFYDMVTALNAYINNSQILEFKLNNKNYNFTDKKGELSQKLTGVFSFAAPVRKNSGSYLANIPLAAVFSSAGDANIATEEKIDKLETPFIHFSEAIDMISSNVAGKNGALSRGANLISSSQNSKSQSMKNFVNGYSVFLLATTEDYENLSLFNNSVAKRCVFTPIKMPISKDEVSSTEQIASNINRGISVYCPKYYCINAKSDSTHLKNAQEFLSWLSTSDLAQKYIVSEFGFSPYSMEDISIIDNALSRSLLKYISENRVLPSIFKGTPDGWCEDNLGKYLVEQYFNKSTWDNSDYENISKYAMEKWKELR